MHARSFLTTTKMSRSYVDSLLRKATKPVEISTFSKGDITVVDGQQIVDNTMKRIMQDRENNVASVVLNYDKLKQLLDVDFERDVKQEPEYIPETNFKF